MCRTQGTHNDQVLVKNDDDDDLQWSDLGKEASQITRTTVSIVISHSPTLKLKDVKVQKKRSEMEFYVQWSFINPVWVGKGIILESVFLCSTSQYFCAPHLSISVQHISQYFPWISIECPDNWPLTGAEIFAICWNRLGVCAQTDRTSPQPPLAVWAPNSVMLADWSPNSTKWCHCLLYKFFAISCPLTNCYPANGAAV